MNALQFRPDWERRGGFSLIELLCVIVIITILSSLLMPAVATVRQKAATTACASNLRQIGISVNLYLADHDNNYPYIEPTDPDSGYPDPYANQPDLQAQAHTLLVTFQPYGVTDKILHCPADLESGGTNTNYAKFGTSYFWNPVDDGDKSNNILVARRMGLRAAQLSRVRQLMDFTPVHNLAPGTIGKSNVLWADGHISLK